jgi:hypothetical protein
MKYLTIFTAAFMVMGASSSVSATDLQNSMKNLAVTPSAKVTIKEKTAKLKKGAPLRQMANEFERSLQHESKAKCPKARRWFTSSHGNGAYLFKVTNTFSFAFDPMIPMEERPMDEYPEHAQELIRKYEHCRWE